MNAVNRFFAIGLSYLLIIGVAGLISAYSVKESMAVTITGNEGLSVDPVDAKVFDVSDMYPGKTVSSDITIQNVGPEPFSLDIGLDVTGGGQDLIDSLKITISDQGADPETDYHYSGKISDLGTQFISNIPSGETQVLVFTLYFEPGRGNVTQNQFADMSWTFEAGGPLGGVDEEGPGPVGPTDPTDFDIFDFEPTDVTPEAEEDVPPEEPLVVPIAAPAEEVAEVAPEAAVDDAAPVEELVVAPDDPQVEPVDEVLGAFTYWPYWLLLLLLPLLFLFFFARRVLVMVPGNQGDYKVVSRKFAWRRDKKWFVDNEKQLDRYLSEHGLVVVDFRGGLIKRASKSVYAGKSILGASSLRYALIGSHRMVTWAAELKDNHSRQVG